MTPTNWFSLIAILVSSIALTVSVITLWKTHFAKFTPILTVGYCSFRIYPIKNGDEKWFIPSFNIPISITNKGAQPGKVENIRIKVTFPELPIPNHYEIFNAKWIVDGNKITKERFEWVDNAVIENWMPMIVLARETKTKNIVFENIRWEEPVIQNKMVCTLEIKTDANSNYEQIAKWNYSLTTKDWVFLVDNGKGFMVSEELNAVIEDKVFPKDLHKYTGTKEDFSKIKIKSSPSYLDYGKKE